MRDCGAMSERGVWRDSRHASCGGHGTLLRFQPFPPGTPESIRQMLDQALDRGDEMLLRHEKPFADSDEAAATEDCRKPCRPCEGWRARWAAAF